MRLRVLVFALLVIGVASQPVRAADEEEIRLVDLRVTPEVSTKRPAALLPLYASLAGLQIYGGYSAMALNNRYGSGNAAESGLSGNPVALWSVKAGVTAYSILVAEQLWRQGRRKRAVTIIALSNAVQAFVAYKNGQALRQPY